MQCFQFSTSETCSQSQRKKCSLPVITLSEELLQISICVSHGPLAKPWQPWHFLDWIIDLERRKEVVKNYTIGAKRSARIKPFRFPPSEESLDVLRRYLAGKLFGCDAFAEQLNATVFLNRKRLSERLDISQKILQCSIQKDVVLFVGEPQELKVVLASNSSRLRRCASRASAGVPPAAARKRSPLRVTQ